MIWLRIQANVATQDKFTKAGPAACWLWLASLGHCRMNLTDGYISRVVVPTLVPGMKKPLQHANRLCSVGLWHAEVDGFRVNDFLEWNPSKEQIDQLRQQDRNRKARVSVRNPDGIQTTPSRARAISVSDSLSVSQDLAAETVETSTGRQPIWNANGRQIRNSPLVGDHRRCDPSTAQACARGVCVPAFMVTQWRAQLRTVHDNERHVESEVRRIVAEELAQQKAGPIGDDPLDFWRAAWKAHHGSQKAITATIAPGKGREAINAFERAGEALERNYDRREGQPAEAATRPAIAGRPPSGKTGR